MEPRANTSLAASGEARIPRHRDPKWIGLRAAVREEPPVHRDRSELARHGHRLHPDLVEQPAGRGLRAREHVGAEVEPVVAAPLGPDASAHAPGSLEHCHLSMPKPPGGREAGDAGTDNDDVRIVLRHNY